MQQPGGWLHDRSKAIPRVDGQPRPADPHLKTRITILGLLAVGASFLTGCVGMLPIPPLSTEVEAGHKIELREATFIAPGTTTRREVEQRLGSCSRDCLRPPSIAYSWETPCWKVVWWLAGPYGGGVIDDYPVGGWHALFVTFDDNGHALQKDFVSLSHGRSLDEQLERWARRVRTTTPPRRPAPAH